MIQRITRNNPERQQAELLKRTRRKTIGKIKRIVGYLLVLGAAAGCNYAVLVVAANSTPEESQRWAKNFLISFGQDMVINQVLKACLTVVICKILYKNKISGGVGKIMKGLMDLVTLRAIAMKSTS